MWRRFMDKEFREFCDLALKKWGEDSQLRMCIEEMSELTKELCKNWRKSKQNTPEQIENICEHAVINHAEHSIGYVCNVFFFTFKNSVKRCGKRVFIGVSNRKVGKISFFVKPIGID